MPVSGFNVETKGVEQIYYENGSVFVKRSNACDVIIHPCGMGQVLEIDETADLEKQLAAATGRSKEKREKTSPNAKKPFRGVLKQ